MWEIAKICVKWLRYVGKRLKYVRNDFKKLGNGLSMWKMTEIYWERLKYMGN